MYKEEKEDIIEAYQLNMQRRYCRGKLIVYIIAICNIIFTLLGNCLGNFNIINIIVQIGLSIALLNGVNWARWLFVIGAVLTLLFTLYIYTSTINITNQIPVSFVVLSILVAIESLIGGSLLAFNKSVSEFFYDQQINC